MLSICPKNCSVVEPRSSQNIEIKLCLIPAKGLEVTQTSIFETTNQPVHDQSWEWHSAWKGVLQISSFPAWIWTACKVGICWDHSICPIGLSLNCADVLDVHGKQRSSSSSQWLERVLSHWAKPAEDNSNIGIPRNRRQAFRALDSPAAPAAPAAPAPWDTVSMCKVSQTWGWRRVKPLGAPKISCF
jgi:hypothetical protein